MKEHSVVPKFVFFVVALVLFSSCPAWSHEPGGARDCSAYTYASPFPNVPPDYTPRYHTVAHGFLDSERNAGLVTASEYAILDAILDEAKSRLKPIPGGLDDSAYEQFAVGSLRTIDCILVSHGFVYP